MKTRSLLVCGLAGVLAAGCSREMASKPQSTAPVPALTDSTEVAVPLPAQTPFDGNPKARAIYLEYYAMGYSFATTDYASPGCMCTAEGDAERYEAAWNGFFAGKEAGSAAASKKRPEQQAPTTAASGTSTASPPALPDDKRS
jgi:hypothetical protein